jgi:uncharacterized protein YceK
MEITMKMISALALVAALVLGGCATVTSTTITTGSVATTTSAARVQSTELTERQINPQRPRDCGRRYVVDPEDPCY